MYSLTAEQRMIQEMTRSYARDKLAPRAAGLDESGEWPKEAWAEMASLGLLGMMVPEEYGGSSMDCLSYCIAMEEVSVACASTSTGLSVQNSLVCDPIVKFGNEEQKRRYLPRLASGDLVGCYCLTEPGSGSDAASLTTTCRKVGDGWVLNGTKQFITNGPEAGLAIVYATMDPGEGHRAICAFLVDRDCPGYRVGKVEKKMGIRGSSTSEILLEDCRVPESALLGKEGRGFVVAMATLDGGRIGIACQALGIARAALEESHAYSQQREAFGQPIAAQQAIQWKLADMITRVDASRLLVWRAAALRDGGHKHAIEASMAKLHASESARVCANEAVQIHGGYGYIREYAVERLYRDAKITELYEGTSEIQRLVIASNLLKGVYRGADLP
jgi:alkylation response protein AidB-like acyl-CoA dehydrogenase